MASWFASRAGEYGQLEGSRRQAFVDQQIDRLKTWQVDAWLAESSDVPAAAARDEALHAGTAGHSEAATWLELARQAEQCIEVAAAEDRQTMRRLAAHVQRRVMWRRLQSLLPPPPAALRSQP